MHTMTETKQDISRTIPQVNQNRQLMDMTLQSMSNTINLFAKTLEMWVEKNPTSTKRRKVGRPFHVDENGKRLHPKKKIKVS